MTSDQSTITPLSSSFYTWGLAHGESMPVDGGTPQAGDAIVLYPSGTSGTTALEDDGDHVGIVTAVHSDGTIDIVNGDFLTSSGIKVAYYQNQNPATFASSSEGSGEEWLYVSPQLPSGAGSELESSPVNTYTQQLQVFGRDSSGATESDVWTPGKSWSGFRASAATSPTTPRPWSTTPRTQGSRWRSSASTGARCTRTCGRRVRAPGPGGRAWAARSPVTRSRSSTAPRCRSGACNRRLGGLRRLHAGQDLVRL